MDHPQPNGSMVVHHHQDPHPLQHPHQLQLQHQHQHHQLQPHINEQVSIMPRHGNRTTGSGNWSGEEKQKLKDIVLRIKRAAEHQALLNPPAAPPRNASATTGTQNQPSPEPPLPWTEIAKEHGTRNAKQCREQWDNQGKWPAHALRAIEPWEADLIRTFVGEDGKRRKWARLGRELNRPENLVKNWWYQEEKKKASRKKSDASQRQAHVDAQRHHHQQIMERRKATALQLPPPHSQQPLPPMQSQLPLSLPLPHSQQPLPNLQPYQHSNDSNTPSSGFQPHHGGDHHAPQPWQQTPQQPPTPRHCPQHNEYRPAQQPAPQPPVQEDFPQQGGRRQGSFRASVDFHSRRPSLASDTPSLASDHDSLIAAESPRSTADGSWYPLSQQRLPDSHYSPPCLERHCRSSSTGSLSYLGLGPLTPRHEPYPYGCGREQDRVHSGASHPERNSCQQNAQQYSPDGQGTRQNKGLDASYSERLRRTAHTLLEFGCQPQHEPAPSAAHPTSTHHRFNNPSDAQTLAPTPVAHSMHRAYTRERASEPSALLHRPTQWDHHEQWDELRDHHMQSTPVEKPHQSVQRNRPGRSSKHLDRLSLKFLMS